MTHSSTQTHGQANTSTSEAGTATSRDTKRWLLPLIAPLLGMLIGILFITPMLGAKAEQLPVAIVNADTGITLPNGETMNGGEKAAENFTSIDQTALDFTVVDASKSTEELLEEDGYYAVITIPEDFSSTQAAAQAGQSDASPSLQATIDGSKAMMGVQTATAALNAMSANAPLNIEVTTVNAAPTDWGFAGSFAPMMIFMATFFGSLVTALMLASARLPIHTARNRWYNVMIQALYGIVLAVCVGAISAWLAQTVMGHDLPLGTLTGFLSLIALGYILVGVGCVNLFGRAGIVIPALTMILGTATLSVPQAFLPGFWAHGIYPWIPARFAGEGIRAILFAGADWLGAGASGAFFWMITLGLVIMCAATIWPKREAQPVNAKEVQPAA